MAFFALTVIMVVMLLPIGADLYAYADDQGIPVEDSQPAIIEQAVITETPPEVIVPEAPAPVAPVEPMVPAAPPAQVELVAPVDPPVPVEPQIPAEPTIPTGTPEASVTPAPTETPEASATPVPTETPAPTETPQPTQSPAVPLSMKLHCDTPNVVAGKSPILLRAEIAGTEAGYTILYQASRDGVPIGQIASADTFLSYVPDSAGTYSFSAYISLPDGRSAADSVTVMVAPANDPLTLPMCLLVLELLLQKRLSAAALLL